MMPQEKGSVRSLGKALELAGAGSTGAGSP